MKPFILIIFLFLFVDLAFSQLTANKKGRFDEIINNSQDDITINPNTSVLIPYLNEGVVKSDASGALSSSDVDLTTEVTGTLPIANGGTGSATQNFVDLTAAQSIGGIKTFTDEPVFDSGIDVDGNSSFSALTTFNGQYVAISTTNGNRPCPVMTEAQRDAITSPSSGDCVVNSDENEVNFYLDSEWTLIGGGGAGGSRLNLPEHPSFERETEGTCDTCSLSLDTTNVLATSNNESSLKIEVDDDLFVTGLGTCARYSLDKLTSAQWHEDLNIIKFAYIKIPEANKATYKFISRKNGTAATEDFLQVPLVKNGKYQPVKLQALSGTTSNGYEIEICNNTGAALTVAESINVDEVEIRPTNSSDFGTVSDVDTDWINSGATVWDATTTAPTKGTTVKDNVYCKREGDEAIIRVEYEQSTAGTDGDGIHLLDITNACGASDIEIDLNKVGSNNNVPTGDNNLARDITVGTFMSRNDATFGVHGNVSVFSSTQLSFRHMLGRSTDSTSRLNSLGTGTAAHEFFTFADGQFSMLARIPIKGWSTGRVNAFSQRREKRIEDENTFVAFVDGTVSPSVVTGENYDWINGNCVRNSIGNYTCNFVSELFSSRPNCRANPIIDAGSTVSCVPISTSSTSINIGCDNTSGAANFNIDLECTRSGTDFKKTSTVGGEFKIEQMKGACFNTTYSETEIECGMRNGEMLYRRCFTVASNLGTGPITVAEWDASLKPINIPSYTTNEWGIFNNTYGSVSMEVHYNSSTGDVVYNRNSSAVILGANSTYCMDYLK